jgi:hypothetical protein
MEILLLAKEKLAKNRNAENPYRNTTHIKKFNSA